MSNDAAGKLLKDTGAAEGGLQSLVVSNLLVNIALGGSLNLLWGMVNALQVTLHIQAINVHCPGNVLKFNSALMNVAYMDLLPPAVCEIFFFWKVFDGSHILLKSRNSTATSTRRPTSTKRAL